MKHLTIREQLMAERQMREAQGAELTKAKADADYIAMMTGVELEQNTEQEGHVDERKV